MCIVEDFVLEINGKDVWERQRSGAGLKDSLPPPAATLPCDPQNIDMPAA